MAGTLTVATDGCALVNLASSLRSRSRTATRSACSRSTAAASGDSPDLSSPSAAAVAVAAGSAANTGCVRLITSPDNGIDSDASRSTK
jgi:hypothetical protein